jgi:hypothetical protein
MLLNDPPYDPERINNTCGALMAGARRNAMDELAT